MCLGSKDSAFGDRKSLQALHVLVHVSPPCLRAQAFLMQACAPGRSAQPMANEAQLCGPRRKMHLSAVRAQVAIVFAASSWRGSASVGDLGAKLARGHDGKAIASRVLDDAVLVQASC